MINNILNNIPYYNSQSLTELFYRDNAFYNSVHDIAWTAASLNSETKRHPFDDLIDVCKNPAYYIENYGTNGREDDPNLGGWLIASSAIITKIIIWLMECKNYSWEEAVDYCVEHGCFDMCAIDTHTINSQNLDTTFDVIKDSTS